MNYDIPQQLSNWDCNDYDLKCIMEICTRKRIMPLDLWELSGFRSDSVLCTYKYIIIAHVISHYIDLTRGWL